MSLHPLNKKIGDNIELLRLQSKKNIKQMAALLGLTETGYRNIERGITEAGTTKLFKLAEIFNVPVQVLLDVKDEEKKQGLMDKPQEKQKEKDENVYQLFIDQYKAENQFLKKQLCLTQELLAKALTP